MIAQAAASAGGFDASLSRERQPSCIFATRPAYRTAKSAARLAATAKISSHSSIRSSRNRVNPLRKGDLLRGTMDVSDLLTGDPKEAYLRRREDAASARPRTAGPARKG